MKTRKGIYWNLKESDYISEYFNIKFYFSSMFYKRKFDANLSNYIDIEKNKLYNKYKISAEMDSFFAVAYYKQVEKRGFRIVTSFFEINNSEVLTARMMI